MPSLEKHTQVSSRCLTTVLLRSRDFHLINLSQLREPLPLRWKLPVRLWVSAITLRVLLWKQSVPWSSMLTVWCLTILHSLQMRNCWMSWQSWTTAESGRLQKQSAVVCRSPCFMTLPRSTSGSLTSWQSLLEWKMPWRPENLPKSFFWKQNVWSSRTTSLPVLQAKQKKRSKIFVQITVSRLLIRW